MFTQQKTNAPTELWQVAKEWLEALDNKPNSTFCKEEIATHADYPALTAITDFLDAGNMKYVAAQADATYIDQFNYPLLAHIKQSGYQYLQQINTIGDWKISEATIKNWSGVVLFAEKDAVWQNAQNDSYNKKDTVNKVRVAVFSFLALSIFLWLSLKGFNTISFSFGLLSLLGVVISIFAFGVELGYQNQLVKQVCGAVSSGGCNTVLKSKFAKGVFGITPADASLIYFTTQFILYLISTFLPNYFYAIAQISLLGIGIAVWSIYTQVVKLKQWCALCLGIVAVLVLQAALGLTTITSTVYTKEYLIYGATFSLLYITFYPIKQLLKTNTINQQKLAELKKWKTDANLFKALWQQEQQVDTTIWENDLVIGNQNASILLTVACNPYCSPCAKAHKQIDELLDKYPNMLKVQVRLLCSPDNSEDKKTKAVMTILKKAVIIKDKMTLRQMLTDWFELMDLDKWNEKWQPTEEAIIPDCFEKHNNWVKQSKIHFTPTFFINGKKIPSKYNLNDIDWLIPSL